MSAKTSQKASRSVTFSQSSSMAIIPGNGSDAKCWYSRLECNRFSQAVANDARRMSRLLATTPRDRITQDELQECLGIETFLMDQHTFRLHQQRRDRHINAVLIGQHLYNKDELSSISSSMSQQAREGARFRAQYLDKSG